MNHELKILPEYFEAVASGEKKFEVRYDDRGYQAGDELILREINRDYEGSYTGRRIRVNVTYVYRGEYCKRGYCIMSISLTTRIMPRTSGLTTLPVCQKCGRGPLLDTYKFCPYCGRSIEN